MGHFCPCAQHGLTNGDWSHFHVLIITACAAFRLHPLVRMHYKAHMTLLNTGLSFQSNCV